MSKTLAGIIWYGMIFLLYVSYAITGEGTLFLLFVMMLLFTMAGVQAEKGKEDK